MKRAYLVLALVVLLLAGCLQQSAPTTANTSLSAPKNSSLPATAQLTGKPSCSKDKVQVIFYHDPYCPACFANEYNVNKFYDKYKDKADIRYGLVATHSRQLAREYGRDEVYQAHDYHVCAQEQGKIQEFKECFYKKLKTDGTEYVPVKANELSDCAKSIGMDEDKLGSCIPDARKKVDATLVEAADFGGGTFFTPMAVVDCQYRVHSGLAEQTYCALTKTC